MTDQTPGPGPEGTEPTPQTPPPASSYPPPAAPPPGAFPPPGGYQASAAGQPVQIGEAFNYGWKKFQENLAPILLGVLAYAVISGILYGIAFAIMSAGAATGNEDAALAALGTGMIFYLIIGTLIGVLFQVGIYRASLEVTYGRPISVKTFFTFTDLGKVVLAALLVAVLSAIPVVGIVVAFFAQFTLLFVLDKGLGPIDALKESFGLVNRNLGTVVILFLGVIAAYFVGSLLCGVGLFVAMPVALIAVTYTYRRLLGESVAA